MDIAVGIGLAALVLAVLVPVTIEWLKRPQLQIEPSPWAPQGPVGWTFAAVRVRNEPLPTVFRWLLIREVAQGCVVSIDFFKWDSKERVVQTVTGRWSSHPEPLRAIPSNPPQPLAASGTATTSPTYAPFSLSFDSTLVKREQDIPVTKGGGEEVAVAVLLAFDEAFAFTDSSYAHPNWGDPNLALSHGTYRVLVRVEGSSVDAEQAFRLEYLSKDFAKFRLELI